jgi:catechol 2,3-dioxygenase-like lactoylglutathione lyase family enzyme
MRGVFLFITGILVGMAIQPGWAQQGHIAGLNHVAVSVADYAGATNFYGKQMGFREAFSFREADGSPYLTYFQVNRDTFVEVMQATPKQRGVQVRAPALSPRTGSRIAVASGPGGIDIELLEFGPLSLHRKVIESWK